MRLPVDYHMHTPLCRHAVGHPREYAAQAVALGLSEIGFSDHSPMARDDFDDWRMRADQLDTYVDMVDETRREFPQLTIRLAMEVDYLPGQEEWIAALSRRHRWDYLIGAVHYVSDSWDIDNPYKLSQWRERDHWEVWSIYFERLIAAANSGLFDIIAHADLPKKFGFIPKRDLTPLFQPFVDAAASNGVAMEINTAGLRKECRELYPGPSLLKMAAQAGVGLTFGSDAHAPAEVGINFKEAVKAAHAAGFKDYCRFEQRQRMTTPIPI